MNIALCSAFRNSINYIDRYFIQVDALNRLLTERGDTLTLVLGYGDSTDATDALLHEHTSGGAIGTLLIDCTHGGPVYGSIVDAERFKQLAFVANKILANIPDSADRVACIESDLAWSAKTILALIDHDVDCVAPKVMHVGSHWLYPGNGPFFYDSYGFVKDGNHFTNEAPYYPGLLLAGLVPMDSVGSCFVMRGSIARQMRIPEDTVIVGACEQIRALGATIWLDAGLTVYHD